MSNPEDMAWLSRAKIMGRNLDGTKIIVKYRIAAWKEPRKKCRKQGLERTFTYGDGTNGHQPGQLVPRR
jgi:hypothetical protein